MIDKLGQDFQLDWEKEQLKAIVKILSEKPKLLAPVRAFLENGCKPVNNPKENFPRGVRMLKDVPMYDAVTCL
eukprot:6885121-Lingulodinium_polyedra.AAC.1